MKKFMRKYGGFVRMFLVLGLVIVILVAIVMYDLWESGKWPVLKSFPSPNGEYTVELVDWDTAGFLYTGDGTLVQFHHDGGYWQIAVAWEDVDVKWAPNGMNCFLTIETLDGATEYRIVEHKSGENPDGVGSWYSHKMIPLVDEPDLQAVLMELCKSHSGFPTGWETVSFTFAQWGGDSETVTFAYQTDQEDSGFLDYHYPSGEITELYQ